MPKRLIETQPKQEISQIEIKQLKTFENILPNLLLANPSFESDKKNKINDYVYFTPISKGKKTNFFHQNQKRRRILEMDVKRN